MLDDRSKMRNGDMPLLDRIDVALRRVTSGEGQMRVPVEATDPDVVLDDCKREIERLKRWEDAAREWLDKTEWVQERIDSGHLPAKYLGKHRADIMRAEVDRMRAESTAMRNQRDELRIVLDKRPAMNAGLLDAYAAWSASVYALDWLDAGDAAMRKEGGR